MNLFDTEDCPHCDEAPLADEIDAHIATVHAALPPCTAFIETEYRETYRCSFRAGHSKERGKYGAWHASKRGDNEVSGRYVWEDAARGAVPHRDPEPHTVPGYGAPIFTHPGRNSVAASKIRVACAALHTDAHGNAIPCPGYPHADSEGRPEPTAAEKASMTAYTGLVIQPYRTDDGRPAWVFRCWGTDDDCDGYLSLDHGSAQSAARALTRHVEECHTPGAPQPEVRFHITGALTDGQRAEVRQIIDEYARRAEREGRVSR